MCSFVPWKKWNVKNVNKWNKSYMRTAEMKSSEAWSSQLMYFIYICRISCLSPENREAVSLNQKRYMNSCVRLSLLRCTSLCVRHGLTSVQQRPYPCPRPPTDWTNYQKCVSIFLSSWLANQQWLFYLANHGAYSNPCTQVGVQNKDFSAVTNDMNRVHKLKELRFLANKLLVIVNVIIKQLGLSLCKKFSLTY